MSMGYSFQISHQQVHKVRGKLCLNLKITPTATLYKRRINDIETIRIAAYAKKIIRNENQPIDCRLNKEVKKRGENISIGIDDHWYN